MSVYALAQFSMAGLLDPMLIVYLLAFYVVTYLVFGSLMLTIGAAVNQMAEAQALMPTGHHPAGGRLQPAPASSARRPTPRSASP